MKIIAFHFVTKHKTKKFNFVDASFNRSDYQSVHTEIIKLLFIFQKKLNMINSLNVNVISKVCTLCAAVSRDFCFNSVSFKTEYLKNLKNEIFISISSFIDIIENHDVILDVFCVIAVTLTNDVKIFKIYI